MTAFMDVLAGLSVAAQLHSAPLNPSPAAFATQSMMLAKEELRSGMYKEYTVDVPEQSNTLDDVRKGYKTAAETDEGKTKVRLIFPPPPPHLQRSLRAPHVSPPPAFAQYWAIFAVLVAGSFIIPMAQYYWYVAEEAD
jgi:hypothetical protein